MSIYPATLITVKSYLKRKTADETLTVMDWLPQNPDLNIIEAVWDHQDRERNKGQPKFKEELWEVLKVTKYNIPEDYYLLKKTSRQSHKKSSRCVNGGHSKYRILPLEGILF